MAYFSNSSEGAKFYDNCAECLVGDGYCPIAAVQLLYNYPAVGNEIATKILAELVGDDGTCQMLATWPGLRRKGLLPEVQASSKASDALPNYDPVGKQQEKNRARLTDGSTTI